MPALCSAVVRAGAIVESGSHAELMARPNGAYATLVKLQAIVHQKDQEVRPLHTSRGMSCAAAPQGIATGAWLGHSCLIRHPTCYETAVDMQARLAFYSSLLLAQQARDLPVDSVQSCKWGSHIVVSNFCVLDVQAAVCRHVSQLRVSCTTCLVAAQDMAFEDLDIAKLPAAEEPGITAFNVSQDDIQVSTGPDLASTWLALHVGWQCFWLYNCCSLLHDSEGPAGSRVPANILHTCARRFMSRVPAFDSPVCKWQYKSCHLHAWLHLHH